jgi:hypothetical protein
MVAHVDLVSNDVKLEESLGAKNKVIELLLNILSKSENLTIFHH